MGINKIIYFSFLIEGARMLLSGFVYIWY